MTDKMMPWEDGRPELQAEIIVITDANSYQAGPSEEHRKRLEKKYGKPVPRPKPTDKKDGEPPPPA